MLDWGYREHERQSIHIVWCHKVSPLSDRKLTCRFGTKYGVDLRLEDSLAAALVDQNPGGQKTAMGGESATLHR